MKKDIHNYNSKNKPHGYQEEYFRVRRLEQIGFDDLFNRGYYKNGERIGYSENGLFGTVRFFIK